MNTQLFLCISEDKVDSGNSIEFFSGEEWDEETEAKLLRSLLELLALLRQHGKSLRLDLAVKADDARRLTSMILKKLKDGAIINGQKLSARELEVLSMIMQGHTNKTIAAKLYISFETVKTHRKNILLKTGAANTAMLINYYHQAFFDNKE